MRHFLFLLFVSSTLWAAVPPVEAGTLTEVGEPPDDRCTYRFDGQIETGDAAKIDTMNTWGSAGADLCLNSPGGSFLEGIAMFYKIWERQIRTHVLDGDSCESACALAWLGGSTDEGNGVPVKVEGRTLEAGGVIGFHAPSLNLPEGGQYSSQAVENAFKIALKGTEGLLDMSLLKENGAGYFDPFLFKMILATPGSSMYRISTVGSALLTGVDVSGVQPVAPVRRQNIINICDTLMALQVDRNGAFTKPSQYRDYARGTLSDAERAKMVLQISSPRVPESDDRLQRLEDGTWVYFHSLYGRRENYCSVEEEALLRASKRGSHISLGLHSFDVNALDGPGWIEAGKEGAYGHQLPHYALYEIDTPLADIRLGREDAEGGFRRLPDTDITGQDLTQTGIKDVSVEGCETICLQTQGCTAYSYLQQRRWCWPKSGGGNTKSTNGVLSGVLR